ncbi:MAG: hypothetical protein QNK85_07845 [Crocinitomicaceae bacterium]
MLKKYTPIAPREEFKFTPSNSTIQAVLSYSKSVEVKKTKSINKILISLN